MLCMVRCDFSRDFTSCEFSHNVYRLTLFPPFSMLCMSVTAVSDASQSDGKQTTMCAVACRVS